MTTLDTVPDGFAAGGAYDIGYTIRQHGMTPINVADFQCRGACTTAIVLTSASGSTGFRR